LGRRSGPGQWLDTGSRVKESGPMDPMCHDGIRVDPNAQLRRQIMLIKIRY